MSKIKDYRPQRRNANRHTQRGLGMLETSIQTDGWIGAITTANDGEVIAGSARLEKSATIFGIEAEPIVIEADGTRPIIVKRTDIATADTEMAKRLALADNRVAQVDLSWDAEVIGEMLKEADEKTRGLLEDIAKENHFEVPTVEDAEPQIDKAEELRQKWGVESGQLWRLGEHRIICGDCTDKAVVEKVMGGERARYAIQDPPYGISVVGGAKSVVGGAKSVVGGANIVKSNSYSPIVGDDKPYDPSYILGLCHDTVLWGANYYSDKLPPKKGWIVWDKKGRDWDDNFSDCELAWTPFEVVTKIYRFVWMGLIQEGEREIRQHPTQKPSKLYEKIIAELFTDDGIIIDFYSGSGTTLIACERLHRKCRAIEISPAYVAVAIQRWVDVTGGTPELIK